MTKIDIAFESSLMTQVLGDLLDKFDDLSEPMNDIAAILESATEGAFEAEADPVSGAPWPSLSDNYLKANPKRIGGKMLQASAGGLAASISADSGDFWASIGSNKIYAAIHHFGGTDDMPAAPAAVPARPYMGLSAEEQQSILVIMTDFWSKV
ncbi:phage virion morphogenesis protein [Shewanella psychrotolerans]|uniref:phage virion morphogenesis protein n=1 Tax=Shewanella psychrotolerans TaxID=2864206 RepID=UPI001C65E1E4|nr:phage virion morphogenesis protein [Shewanella psychrotolerans]QYK02790.1 phage virion morphogenesis protein [Shewanella psychrotolerans]